MAELGFGAGKECMRRGEKRYLILDVVWSALKALGLSRKEIAAKAGLPSDLGRGEKLTGKQFFAIWNAAAALSRDPGIGFRIAAMLAMPAHTPPIFALIPASLASAIHARDFTDAVRRISRFRIVSAPREILVEEDEGTVACVVRARRPEETGEDVPSVIVDADFYAMVLLLRRGTCRELSPESVELRRAPGSEKFLERYYGCPVVCGANRNALILSRVNAYYPFVDYNKELFELLTRHEPEVEGSGFISQVGWIVDRLLSGGRPGIGEVASEMALGKRTFQRMLSASGTTFHKVVADRRMQRAREYLKDGNLSLSQVSCLLGFDNQNSFSRSFRSWFGCTPSEWRSSHVAEGK